MTSLRDPRDALEDARPDAPAGLFFSRLGHWFHDGDRIFHAGLSGLLDRSVARADDDTLIVTTGRDVLPFEVEDAPLLVRRVDQASDGTVSLVLSTTASVPLTWLAMGSDDRLRAPVVEARCWALLSRNAGQALEPLLAIDDDGSAWVVAGDVRHPVVHLDATWRQPPPASPPIPGPGVT